MMIESGTEWRGRIEAEIERWDHRRVELATQYQREGMTAEAADDKATAEVRREIRNDPSIGLKLMP